MYFWYFLVTDVSIFDNLVAAPISRSWTIRVSRRPSGVLLDQSRIRIATDQGSGYSRTCFYVVISVHGISRLYAIAQIAAKGSSVAVFAFGTALFSSRRPRC
ncbi:hypothetical protein CONLIGDRAFT_679315 [Coniochaeta ligniaria NRRL 30616]|uniref:Uncharacterized protein n=1 Tax=Coniochaeta ligniaria NRRL 30616 TaxID=1408157 RepID=A0A1J7IT76_9PEZI|nr:hypothetical protein CONLIGDRAFT_679315 [Coniochaeta ligniaria NRRL 30616]